MKLLAFSFLTFYLFTSALDAQNLTVGSYLDTTGVVSDTLVAHYPFTGNANDSSGFGNDGQVSGATLTTDRFGNLNSAYEFDGIDDYIKVSDADQLTPTNSRFSISVWFKTEFPGDRFILYKGSSSTNREYAFGVRSDSLGSFQINENGSASNRDWVVTKNVIEENVWQHLVGVWDSSSVKIYLNNKLENIDSTDLTISNFASDLYIGTYGGAINQYAFYGKIDDLKFFNSSLDSLSVSELFHYNGWPETFGDTLQTIPDTLVAHYPFKGNANDSSGFGNDGVVVGASLSADRFGNLNNAYVFDGDDYINFGSSDFIEFGKKDFSFSLWFRALNDDRSQYQILRKGNDHATLNEARWAIELIENGKIRVIFEDAENEFNTLVTNGQNQFLDEQWHHLVAVFDRDNSLRVYVDNELDLEDQRIKNFSGHITNKSAYNLYAGRDNTGNPAKGFSGSMDDIRIYSYALGAGAIQQLFNGDDNVVVSNEEAVSYVPRNFKLHQNYPNPFNPSTRINFSLERAGFVELKVYDITGRLISTLVSSNKTFGSHSVIFNGGNLASGIYFYELKANGRRAIKRFTLIK